MISDDNVFSFGSQFRILSQQYKKLLSNYPCNRLLSYYHQISLKFSKFLS